MDLSIVILSYNTRNILLDCLKSIIRNVKKLNYELIVVDNASSDNSANSVEKDFPQVKLIRSPKNLGFAAGNNLGVKKTKGKYLLFLNSDTLLKEGSLEGLVNYMEKHPEVGAIGPKLLNEDGTSQGSAGAFPSLKVVLLMLFKEHFGGSKLVRTSYSDICEVDWLMGSALLIRKDVFLQVGGFDENIFMYYDEVELCYRIRKANFSIIFNPNFEIIHLWQRSSTSGRSGPILGNYKGLLYFYRKHKSYLELLILKIMLKFKAVVAYIFGCLTGNRYLKETYEEAIKLV